MKLKRITAALLAAAVTVSSFTINAFADSGSDKIAVSTENDTYSDDDEDIDIPPIPPEDDEDIDEPEEPDEPEPPVDPDTPVEPFSYDVLDDGTIKITEYNGNAENVDIPKMIDGKSVTSIDAYAFGGCESFKSITIPDSVTSIDECAFKDCTSLTSITIPGSVTSIGKCAFYGCTSLTNITIPSSVTSIGESAFRVCTSLTGITIPDGVKNIESEAFRGCVNLKSVVIPDGITSVGYRAFYNCNSLKSISIPASVTAIYSQAFGYHSDVGDSIDIDDSYLKPEKVDGFKINYIKNTRGHLYAVQNDFSDETYLNTEELDNGTLKIVSYAGKDATYVIPSEIDGKIITEIGYEAFSYCDELTSITIPASVTMIGDYAFFECQNLKSLTISDGVTRIGYEAFYGCLNLTAIDVTAGNKKFLSVNGIVFSKDKTDLLYYPAGKMEKSYTIPDGVTGIRGFAFENCKNLLSVTIPDSVTYIGMYALGYSHMISIGEGVEKINVFNIYCYAGTSGEQYAKDNDFTYELLTKPTLSKVTGAKLGGRAADALRVNWTKNANADGYIIEMYQGNKWVRAAKITNNSTTTFRKAGLKASSVYKFRVRAYKMSGKTAVYSDYSATVAARTNPSVMKGAKLGGRAADALRINWTKNASADGYIVEMYQGNKWVRVGKITNNSTTTFRKAGLKASSVYKFRVRAYKMSGSTALYGNYSATVTARTNPSIMKGVKIGGKAKDALRVNWTKNASAQGYIVEMYKGGKWVRVAKITNGNTTTFRKAGLAKNTTYKFRVRAYHMSGKTALYGNYGSVSGRTAAK